jgi:peptidoglycan hydrolase-like protein with peptidoglycan-binding domain
MAALSQGALGDLVVWAQEHLVSAGERLAIDGAFGPKTEAAVQAFQTAHGLPVTGVIDTTTWDALLRYPPAYVHWTQPRKHRHAARGASAGTSPTAGTPPPISASLPDVRDEIAGAGGAGRPR